MEDVTMSLRKTGYKPYPNSFRSVGSSQVFVAKKDGREWVGVKQGEPKIEMEGANPVSDGIALYELTWDNYQVLARHLPLRPSTTDRTGTFGTGDRLGMATAAHLSALMGYDAFPVVAQQSPRELERTGRTFKSVLLDAVMGVLESGYQGEFGADADHVKDEPRLLEGLEAGYSMYTLDVGDDLRDLTGVKRTVEAELLTAASRKVIKSGTGRKLKAPGVDWTMSGPELTKSALVYEKAMLTVVDRYKTAVSHRADIDLEVSIDEGGRETTFEDHYYVAEFLHVHAVDFRSLAPKFPGEFQKAVDFRGSLDALSASFHGHATLAREIQGYRLSLHSGSDKFSVYSLLAKAGMGCFHIKTSGTSWLQAVKVVAEKDASLFADMYSLCCRKLTESKKAYHVDITPEHFPAEPLGDIAAFYARPEVQQLFHISYGALLGEYRDRMLAVLRDSEEEHYANVAGHIDRHLKLLFGG
jgi:hypothetical protein